MKLTHLRICNFRCFGGVETEIALDDTTFILGPNGAGKTSLFNVLTGFDQPDTGEVVLYGRRVDREPAWKIARRGMVRSFQTPVGFPLLSVWENLMTAGADESESLWSAVFRRSRWTRQEREVARRADRLLDELGLGAVKDQRLEDLTAGQTKLVDFARLMMVQPQMVLLDEPAAGLNPAETKELNQLIISLKEDYNVSVVLIEHDMSLVMDISDRINVINQGRPLASGTPEEIRQNDDVIKAYLGEA